MEVAKLRDLSDEDLQVAQKSAAEQLFRIRFQKSLGNQEGLKKLQVLKLDIARSKTVARERVIAKEKLSAPVLQSQAPSPSTRTARKQNRTQV